MKFFLSVLLIAVLSIAPGIVHAAGNVVGVVLEVEGKAQITNASGSYDAAVNTEVHPQDVLTTGPGSRLYIQFIDNTEFTLSENAQFTVEEYNFDEKNADKNYATYSVLQGAFLYVSGLVAKKENPDVKVNIPQGSIGIRGTKFWGGEVDGEYGVIVGEGKVTVKNKGGSATLVRGQGTTLKDRITKPTAPKKWSPEKINKATATVALKDPAVVGARMVEARNAQTVLRAEHAREQVKVQRIDPAILEERVEQKILAIRPEMRPDLNGGAVDTNTDTNTDTKVEEKKDDSSTLRDRLKQERLNSTSQGSVQDRLNSTMPKDLSATATTTETTRVLSPVDKVLNDAKMRTEALTSPTTTTTRSTTTADPGTSKTTTIVKETSDTVTDTGTRALTTTTETTTTVRDVVNDTVKTTSDVVEKVEETPIVKDVTTTTDKVLEPVAKPLGDTIKSTTDTDKPATNALRNLRENALGTRTTKE